MNIASEKDLKYSKKIKLIKFLFPALILFFWEIIDRFCIFDTFLISSPTKILKCIIKLNNTHELWRNLSATLYEISVSFALCNIIALLFASVLWIFPALDEIFSDHLMIFYSIPKVAIAPLVIVWLGNTQRAIIAISLLIGVIPGLIQILSGFKNTSIEKINLARVFGANRFETFKKIIFPDNLSIIISAAKVMLGMSFIGVITGEFLVAEKGIGYLVTSGGQLFKPDLIISGIFLLILITIIFTSSLKLFSKLKKYFTTSKI